MIIKVGIAYNFLSKRFEKHGRRVTRYVSWFLVSPVFITLLLATGLQKVKINVSDNKLYTYNGIIGRYKSRLSNLFPTDSSEIEPGRSLEEPSYGTVIVEPKDNGSVLRQAIFQEIIILDEAIRNITITDEGEWKYEDLCARNNRKCWQNAIIRLNSRIAQIENKTLLLKYPITGNRSKDFNLLSLGGVTVNEKNELINARAIRLIYFLSNLGKTNSRLSRTWEKKFIDNINKLKFSKIEVVKDISTSFEESKVDVLTASKDYFPYSFLLMISFTVLTSLSPDFLRSKPWIGIMSAFATGMSIVSGFGLLTYFGFEVLPTVILVPFLIFGIGMDDTFIMLSAWKKTEKSIAVEEKLAKTLSESGVSVTISSLTNIASFAIGIIFNSVPEYRTFCIFMAICLTFDYIYQITFIGALLVYCGKAEERNLHSLFFVPLQKNSSSGGRSFLRDIFCYVQTESTDKRNCAFINNFWINFSRILTTTIAKALVVMCYFVYLGFAIWGFSKLSYEATLNLNVLDYSYRHHYYELQKQYFYKYQYRLQFIILEKLDYADPFIQEQIEESMQMLESDPLIAGSVLTESWLRSYLRLLSDKRAALLFSSYNVTDKKDFVFVLRNFFLRIPQARRFKNDISFDSNNTNIIASRFLLQTNVTRDGNHFYHQFVKLRKKLDRIPFATVIYHPSFYFFDLIDAVPLTASQTITAVLVTIFFVSAVFLPSFISIVCVLFNIVSVGVGVLGYMTFCNINMTVQAITILIIVIGLSVDNAAHVACAYVSSSDTNPNVSLMRSICMTAMPILQGCVTTLLAIILNVLSPSLEFKQAIMILFISCVLSVLHGIFYVPVMMSILSSFWMRMCQKRNSADCKISDIIPTPETLPNIIVNIEMKKLDYKNVSQ